MSSRLEISSDNNRLLLPTVFRRGDYIVHSVKSLFDLTIKIAFLPEALLLRVRKKKDAIDKFYHLAVLHKA